jgi:hypothetical protein
MLPSPPSISRCEGCERVFFREDAAFLGDSVESAFELRTLGEDELYDAIESGVNIPPDRELQLRILVWQVGNSDRREHQVYPVPAPARSRSQRFCENLLRIIALIDEADRGSADALPKDNETVRKQVLIRAEAFRELGRFAEAADLISSHDWGETLPFLARIIADAALMQDDKPKAY